MVKKNKKNKNSGGTTPLPLGGISVTKADPKKRKPSSNTGESSKNINKKFHNTDSVNSDVKDVPKVQKNDAEIVPQSKKSEECNKPKDNENDSNECQGPAVDSWEAINDSTNIELKDSSTDALSNNLESITLKNNDFDLEESDNSTTFEKIPDKSNKGYEKKEQKHFKSSKDTVPQAKYSSEKTDDEFKAFESYKRNVNFKLLDFKKVEEKPQDLFMTPKEYSLAHCVAEDMSMGSGIAVQFRREFKKVDELLDQRQRQGGLAVLENGSRYIYYLVTKRESNGKPTYEKFFSSLQKWRNHVMKHEVKQIAIPRIGCGLDRLEWDIVKLMVEFVFRDVDTKITVCNFQQDTDGSPPPPQRVSNCKVVHQYYPITRIEEYTTIIHFASESGEITEEIKELGTKFPGYLNLYQREKKTLGNIIKFDFRNKYIIYGCVVRKKLNSDFNFSAFQKCISVIQKNNRQYKYSYVAYQAISDKNEDLINEKIINLLRNSLTYVDVYVCWPEDLSDKLPSGLLKGDK